MAETREARLKRMKMRSWRRGIKEMDLILGPYADARLPELDADTLELYDQLLEENDQDLYPWVSGAQPCPPQYLDLLSEIGQFARERHITKS
ncbi:MULTISPECIES: succinate dehydrogenase assembly factor 2 [Thioclava]|uniref:FAD assembly factor SdhE n=1 Tax=Thioclava nitratireducens TaxID=1915078 RepID=A0ABN4XI05_9RHOB|nr:MULTISPECIES: succinate dehydrogenase assembly factor 2 [Thioclava]AQS48938.1 succinate dehydrogenase assembly factor 2 [Thioclava nitratireducens]OWX99337.1 succinate dehydrogenase assembly factor 2 [Thioclava sp. IC9]OWY01695.1 succinate dehydrogenase assembly factor 2 [Thioclava sp. F1Mire-8]OWY10004.1 succinate dehydrogenase assembly factor 2 [Thioclava sp. F42-5]OWY12346.1 succinate dehydrogenase assembly factor 2 [Thioclava sp. F34-6]